MTFFSASTIKMTFFEMTAKCVQSSGKKLALHPFSGQTSERLKLCKTFIFSLSSSMVHRYHFLCVCVVSCSSNSFQLSRKKRFESTGIL